MRIEVHTLLGHLHQELHEEQSKKVQVDSLEELEQLRVRHMCTEAAQHARWSLYRDLAHIDLPCEALPQSQY